MATPEKLNLWDRLFNRTRREVHQRGNEKWKLRHSNGLLVAGGDYYRDWVEYKIIDRVTGSETIERKYLNGLGEPS